MMLVWGCWLINIIINIIIININIIIIIIIIINIIMSMIMMSMIMMMSMMIMMVDIVAVNPALLARHIVVGDNIRSCLRGHRHLRPWCLRGHRHHQLHQGHHRQVG